MRRCVHFYLISVPVGSEVNNIFLYIVGSSSIIPGSVTLNVVLDELTVLFFWT